MRKNLLFWEKSLTVKYAIILLFFLFSSTHLLAQDVKRLNDEIKLSKKISDGEKEHSFKRFTELTTQIGPKLYLKNGQVHRYSDQKPLVIEADMQSLYLLQLQDPEKDLSDAEVLVLKLGTPSDLQFPIDFKVIENIKKLRYIYFLVEFKLCPEQKNDFECEKLKIKSLFKDELKPNITILYNISIPN